VNRCTFAFLNIDLLVGFQDGFCLSKLFIA
jgi:hypothetical protein